MFFEYYGRMAGHLASRMFYKMTPSKIIKKYFVQGNQ